MSIKIHEIFFSLQGEASRVGLPTVFVRLTGCPLRCGYCDTAYAFHGGDLLTVDDIMTRVAEFGMKRVTVTGGEPLAQKECLVLLKTLCDNGYDVSLETSGAMDIAQVDDRVSVILDVKTPGSGEESKNLWSNIPLLKPKDEVKFVLCDQADYAWAKQILHERGIHEICPVLFSPVYGQLQPHDLAEWILEDKLQVRLQVQLHKILWGEVAGK
ncbi:MAG TPA: 7-carboxy-7-deazaguanine synthase QueE [Methylophilaceae bacterium]